MSNPLYPLVLFFYKIFKMAVEHDSLILKFFEYISPSLSNSKKEQ